VATQLDELYEWLGLGRATPPSVSAALARCGLSDGAPPRQPRQPRRRRLAALATARGAARGGRRGAARQPKALELAHRYRVCGAPSGRNASSSGRDGPGSP